MKEGAATRWAVSMDGEVREVGREVILLMAKVAAAVQAHDKWIVGEEECGEGRATQEEQAREVARKVWGMVEEGCKREGPLNEEVVQLLGEVGRKVQLAVKGSAVWQARAGTRVCEARLEDMGALYTHTENVLEVRWCQHQRRDILDMYDEVVAKEARWGGTTVRFWCCQTAL